LALGAVPYPGNPDPDNQVIYEFNCDEREQLLKTVQFNFNGNAFIIDAKDYVSVQINEGFLPLCLSAFFGRDTPNIVDENGHVVEHEISVIIGQSVMRSWVVAYDMGM
jgi:hypothetical protein